MRGFAPGFGDLVSDDGAAHPADHDACGAVRDGAADQSATDPAYDRARGLAGLAGGQGRIRRQNEGGRGSNGSHGQADFPHMRLRDRRITPSTLAAAIFACKVKL
jgi:hypothetical protein